MTPENFKEEDARYIELMNCLNKGLQPTGNPVTVNEHEAGLYLLIPGWGCELSLFIDRAGSITGFVSDTSGG